MKNIILILLALYFLWSILSYKDNTIAVVKMDTLGHYRVDNFHFDKDCIHFVDGIGTEVKFCGAYRIVEKRDFYKLEKID